MYMYGEREREREKKRETFSRTQRMRKRRLLGRSGGYAKCVQKGIRIPDSFCRGTQSARIWIYMEREKERERRRERRFFGRTLRCAFQELAHTRNADSYKIITEISRHIYF